MSVSAEQARFNMVEQQVRPWEVVDSRVLDTLLAVPRDAFVPEQYKGLAYADMEIPLGNGANMLKPVIEGRLLQALAIKPTDKILEIGTGSGYLTACLAHLGAQVTSTDVDESLSRAAAEKLAALGIDNVELVVSDDLAGAFDVIAVTGSVPVYDGELQKSLTDNGRLFIVTGQAPVMQAQLITRLPGGQFRTDNLFETVIAPLRNAPQPKGFVF